MKITLKILMALGGLLLAWEVKTLADDEEGNTVSATLCKVAENQPFVAFMYFMLGTHLFKKHLPLALLAASCGLLAWPLVDGQEKSE